MDTNVCFEGQSGSYKKNGKAKKTELRDSSCWLTDHHSSSFPAPKKTFRQKPKALDLPHPLRGLLWAREFMWILPTQFITAGQWWSKWSIHALHCLQNCDRCGCTYNKSPISNQSIAYMLTLQDRNSTKLKQKLEYTKLFNLKTSINTLMREGRTSTPQNLFSIQTKKAIQVSVFTSQKLTQIVHCRSVKIITMNFLKNGIQIKIRGGWHTGNVSSTMLLSLSWNPSLSLSGNWGWMLVGRHPPSLISTSLTPVKLLLEFKKQPPNTMTPPKQKHYHTY